MERHEAIATRWKARAPLLVAVMLVAFAIGDLYHFMTQWRLAAAPAPTAAPRAVRVAAHRALASAHLFGVLPDEGAPVVSGLPLDLVGVIALPDPQTGYAIIAEHERGAHLYAAGATLIGTAGRVHQVFADHVVLEVNGRLESLFLPHAQLAGAADTMVADATAQKPAAARKQWRPSLALNPIPRAINPAEGWFERIGERRYRDGHLSGIEMHTPPRYQKLYGIHPGDLVTAIDGVAITDNDGFNEMLQNANRTMTLTINRGGTLITQTIRP